MANLRILRHIALALALAAPACGPAPTPNAGGESGACEGSKMPACERALASGAAEGDVSPAKVDAYVAARAARDARDPWVTLWSALSSRKTPEERAARAVVVVSRGPRPRDVSGARVIEVGLLPAPSHVPASELLLAMSVAAGLDHVVWLDDARAHELYPRDPLAPQMVGLAPIARDDATPGRLAANVALAASVRRAFEAAGSFRYVDAAAEAASIDAQIQGRDGFEEPVLRARYARAVLSAAGITLEDPVDLFGPSAPRPPSPRRAPAPDPSAADSPYGDLLRVRLAEDPAVEWRRRGAKILPAISGDRRALAESHFGGGPSCGAAPEPPDFTRPGDVALAGLLPGALAGAREEAISTDVAPGLSLQDWYPRYERLVALVDRSRMAWLHIGTLLRQRGEVGGIRPTGTAAYRRVTALGLSHVTALRELAAAHPGKYQATAQLGLAYAPGLLGDDALRGALVDLTQASTRGKLAVAAEPGAIAAALLVGAFAGMTYPPAVRDAHYLALQSAFAARIKGDLTSKTGWGAALLFAADAIVRLFADLSPNLAFSSDQIARALAGPEIEQPNVAAVVSAIVRYAALAKDRPLAANVSAAQSTPERAAARETLRRAIVGMGAPGEAPPSLADDLTTLADGLIATLTVRLHAKPPPPGTCAARDKRAADIEIEHALTKLRAVRQKILRSPSFEWGAALGGPPPAPGKSEGGLWLRRARLFVTLLSDAMDFAAPAKPGAKRALTLSAADVESALGAALAEWREPGGSEVVVSLYSLIRFFLAGDAGTRFERGGPPLVRALGGVGRFLRAGGAAESPTMLDALADMTGRPGGPEDIGAALVAHAKVFHEKGQADQGDLFLLGALLVTSIRRTAPPPEAIALAAQHRSRIAWALSLFSEVHAADTTGRPDVARVRALTRGALEERCAAGADDVSDVLAAIADYTSGKRKEARAALSAVVARAEARGLVVPRLDYRYAEKHDHKVFNLSFGLTQGAGFVEGGNTFQIGLGISTLPERTSKLTVSAASPSETAADTARYYVRVAALSAAYDFLDGDAVSGATAARRAVSALVQGARLGPRSITAERARWAEDARSILAVDAELAAAAGMPFLAGDLWTVVKDSLPPDFDDAKVDALLASPPMGLAGVSDAAKVIERARKSLQIVAARLACTGAKVETSSHEQPSCEVYPLSLSLRIADVIDELPKLRRAGSSAQGCPALAALDTFLRGAERGTYDPDAFTRAVEALRSEGRADEAASLLARQRREGHCNPTLLSAARSLGRSAELVPATRADMLSIAVSCAGADGAAALEDDLAALDAETQKLADPMRNLKVLFFAADLSLRSGKPKLLLPLTQAPGFVDRSLALHPNATAAALLLHHAAHVLAGEALDVARTEGAFSLVCGSFLADERRAECDDLSSLRAASPPGKAPSEGDVEARKKLARDALTRLLAPPAKKP